MNKKKLAEMFGIETHDEDLQKMSYEKDSLLAQIVSLRMKNDSLKEELEFYKLNDEEKVQMMREDIKDLADTYIKNIQIYQELIERCNNMIDDMDDKLQQMYNRGLAHGRQAAYSEMGIWRLDAIKDGNRLVMDACGDVYELLELEDVKAEDTGKVTDDEIIIDDLEYISA